MIDGMAFRPTLPWRRHLASALILVVLVLIVLSAVTNDRFRWHVVGEYLFHPDILAGIWVTVSLTVIVMVVSVIIGTLVALMRLSTVPLVSFAANAYITVFRSIPMLALILLFYNIAALYPSIGIGMPGFEMIWSVPTNDVVTPWVAAITALILHEVAYTAEVIRAGIISINPGQREASVALGMNESQAFLKVILPQAMRVILPPLGNLVIALMKATSLVSVIAVADLLHSAKLIYSVNYETIPLLIVAIVWYFVLTTILSIGQSYLERRLSQSPANAGAAKSAKMTEVEA